MKRALDLTCVLVGIFLFGLPCLIVALCIWLDDGSPIFFRQQRLGKTKSPIEVLKFRTFRDGKVTRAGKWLRQSGLDELPQLVNVWRGEMSAVGPRPLTQLDVDRLGWNAARVADRWSTKPGLTGLAQIYGGVGARHSLRLDRLYARRQTARLDFRLILLTLGMNAVGKRRVRRWLVGERRAS